MTERSIVFTPEHYGKIVAGEKTQTRRIAKVNHADKACPFGQPGDRLYVKESFTYRECEDEHTQKKKMVRWEDLSPTQQASMIERAAHIGEDYLVYKRDGVKRSLYEWVYPHPIFYEHCLGKFGKTVPSICMPPWAARLWLELTAVRVERLQDISYDDEGAEGVTLGPECNDRHSGFMAIWEWMHGPGSWDRNPFVWVLSFKRIEHDGR